MKVSHLRSITGTLSKESKLCFTSICRVKLIYVDMVLLLMVATGSDSNDSSHGSVSNTVYELAVCILDLWAEPNHKLRKHGFDMSR